jgi:predicted Holliday junction resolvase-like endonuclease
MTVCILVIALIPALLSNHNKEQSIGELNHKIDQIHLNYTAEMKHIANEHASQLDRKELELQARIEEAREQSLKQSRATMRGQATEHLAPLVMEGFNPKDFRFVGQPIDYLVVKGLSDVTDREGSNVTVYLLEIKSGNSQLTKVQRAIRDAVVRNRVVFATFNPDTGSMKEWKQRDAFV